MSYIPNTDADIRQMLEEIGVRSANDLFHHIPDDLRVKKELDLPGPLSELELLAHMEKISRENANLHEYSSFLGGGVYYHFIPPVVGHLTSRSEFYTAYTPYQPEISQGTLQAIFEYQTLMCMLTGMDVSNASVYDGASSAAEAARMSLRVKKKNRIVVSKTLHPEYRKVIKTYVNSSDKEMVEVAYNDRGVTDIDELSRVLDDSVSCVIMQSPNFFGVIEEPGRYEKIIHKSGSLYIAAFTEPLAFGMLRPPGTFGADIVCGEGQSLGIPPGFGGPYLGILTCKKDLVRNMPGRIVGRTIDKNGRTAFVLTLAAREQHIRREKATSNICTNQGLCALTAAVYLTALGKQGLRKVSCFNHSRAEYAKSELCKIDGINLKFNSQTFNEFVIQTTEDPAVIEEKLLEKRILPGIPLKRFYRELSDCLLVAVTEMNSVEEIDELCSSLKSL